MINTNAEGIISFVHVDTNDRAQPQTYDYRTHRIIKDYGPSLTLPDQSLPIKDILLRHSRGLPLTGSEVVYHGEELELPNLKTMDLAEIAEMREAVQQFNIDVRARYKKEQEEHTKKIAEAKKKERQGLMEEFQTWYKNRKNEES